jgi:predicted DNA-binding transcriptional regulator YafY
MASSVKALKRYEIYDKQLQGGKGRTKEQLMQAVYEETREEISERTFVNDLQKMREDEYLGFNAPIKYVRGRHYIYENKNYTINASKITRHQLRNLRDAISILSRFKNLPFMSHIVQVVEQLEFLQSNASKSRMIINNPIVELEVPSQWPDSNILKDLYLAINNKKEVQMTYQPFNEGEELDVREVRQKVKPLLIKEYQNRLYLIAMNEAGEIRTFGLERIQAVNRLEGRFKDTLNSENYFKYALGITVPNNEEPHRIELLFGRTDANYVKTSRLHETQEIIREDYNGLLITITVYKSKELIRMVRSFGSGVKVISPDWLANAVKKDAQDVVEGNLRN